MRTSSPGNGQYGGVLAGVKATPPGGLRPALTPAAGTTPPQLPGGSSKQLHHNNPYNQSLHGIRGGPHTGLPAVV